MSKDKYEYNKKTRFSKTNQPENRGRPKGSKSLKTIIQKYLDVKVKLRDPIKKKDNVNKTVEEHIILQSLQQALDGDDKARKFIFDRGYGKAEQTIKLDEDTINKLDDIFNSVDD